MRLRPGEGVGTVAQRREGMIVNAYQQSPYARTRTSPISGSLPSWPNLSCTATGSWACCSLRMPNLGDTLHRRTANSSRCSQPRPRSPLRMPGCSRTVPGGRRGSPRFYINKRIAAHEDMASLLARAEEATPAWADGYPRPCGAISW